jgi:LysM repeat protein
LKGTTNRARYLAPIALVATIAATYLIVHDATRSKTSTVHSQTVRQRTSSSRGKPPRRHGTFYTVKAGDTLSAISARTGISLPTLEQLNPGVDPGALQTGQRLRLRR